jgi:internalin A
MEKLLWLALLLSVPAAAAAVDGADETGWIEKAGGTFVRNGSGQITAVNFRASWVTDGDLRRLSQLPALSSLDLSLTRVTDQGMQELRSLPGIVELNLRFAEYVTDEGLAAIKGWKKLKRLVLHGTKVSDTSLEHIAGITSLETLDLGSVMLTDVGLERLTVLPNLKALTIGGNELGDAGLQALRQMPGLTFLDISGRQGTDSNVWAISMSDVGLEAVLTLSNLRELRFGCTSIGVGIEGAKFATVSMMSVTPRWLEKMKALPKLQRLKLQGCDRVDDSAVPILASFPSIEEVDLKGTAVTEKGLAALRTARPKVRVFHGPWDAKAANFRNN